MEINPFWKTLKVIWDNPKLVFVDNECVKKIAKELAIKEFEVPVWREEIFPKTPREFVEFIGVANLLNFCFTDPFNPLDGKYFFIWRDKKWAGSLGMAAALRAALENGKPILDYKFLRNLKKSDVADIFCEYSDIPLIDERLESLRQIGCNFNSKTINSFWDIFELGRWKAFDAKNSFGIISVLTQSLPRFNDYSFHRESGGVLRFYKRAQLLLMVYQGRALAEPQNFPMISDYELLGPAPDYALPKVLRYLGILIYADKLAKKVDNWKIIFAGSLEEQEIRAQTVNAMIRLRDEINAVRGDNKKINMLELDYFVWSLGRDMGNIPHHLTETVAY